MSVTRYFDGQIENACIGSAALSASERTWFYNSGDGKSYSALVAEQGGANVPDLANLAHWYRLDEQSGTRRDCHGTLHLADNNTVTYAAGNVAEYAEMEDRALAFVSASNQYAEVNASGVTTYPLTLVGWMKSNSAHTGNVMFVGDKDSAVEYQAIYVSITPTRVFGQSRSGTGNQSVSVSAVNVFDNKWHMVAHVATSATSRLVYVDGNTGTGSTNVVIGATYDRTSIGRFGDSVPDSYFNGSLDNCSIWSVALSTDELNWLYNNGIGRTYGDLISSQGGANVPAIAGLVAWYPLNTLHPDGAGVDVHGTADLTLYAAPTDTPGIPSGQSPPGMVWRWTDQSGNGHHLTQDTIGLRPQYIKEVVNSLPALLGDGVDDYLQVTYGSTTTEPHDTWLVFKLIDTGAGTVMDGITVTTEQGFRIDATPNYEIDAGTVQVGGTPNTSAHIGLITWTTTDVLYIDGVAAISANAGTEGASGMTLFNDLAFAAAKDVYLCEVVKTSAAHTTAQRNAIQNYLADKYNITVTPLT